MVLKYESWRNANCRPDQGLHCILAHEGFAVHHSIYTEYMYIPYVLYIYRLYTYTDCTVQVANGINFYY